MAFLCCLQCTRQISELCVIELERSSFDSLRRISQRHFTRVPEQTEAGNVSNGMNCVLVICMCFDLMQSLGSGAIQRAHGADRGGDGIGGFVSVYYRHFGELRFEGLW